jgi:hypothetical protein
LSGDVEHEPSTGTRILPLGCVWPSGDVKADRIAMVDLYWVVDFVGADEGERVLTRGGFHLTGIHGDEHELTVRRPDRVPVHVLDVAVTILDGHSLDDQRRR